MLGLGRAFTSILLHLLRQEKRIMALSDDVQALTAGVGRLQTSMANELAAIGGRCGPGHACGDPGRSGEG
jgi:hypothetical protein